MKKINKLRIERDAAAVIAPLRGYISALFRGQIITQEFIDRINQHYLPQLREDIEKNLEKLEQKHVAFVDGHGDVVQHSDLYDECQSCKDKEEDLETLRGMLSKYEKPEQQPYVPAMTHADEVLQGVQANKEAAAIGKKIGIKQVSGLPIPKFMCPSCDCEIVLKNTGGMIKCQKCNAEWYLEEIIAASPGVTGIITDGNPSGTQFDSAAPDSDTAHMDVKRINIGQQPSGDVVENLINSTNTMEVSHQLLMYVENCKNGIDSSRQVREAVINAAIDAMPTCKQDLQVPPVKESLTTQPVGKADELPHTLIGKLEALKPTKYTNPDTVIQDVTIEACINVVRKHASSEIRVIDEGVFEKVCELMERAYRKTDEDAKFHDVGALRGYVYSSIRHYLASAAASPVREIVDVQEIRAGIAAIVSLAGNPTIDDKREIVQIAEDLLNNYLPGAGGGI